MSVMVTEEERLVVGDLRRCLHFEKEGKATKFLRRLGDWRVVRLGLGG